MARKKRGRKLSKKEVKAIKKAEANAPVVAEQPIEVKPKLGGTIALPHVVTVGDFAKRLGVAATDVVKTLFANGIMATINESIDRETAMLVADEYGATVVDQTGESVGEIATNERVMTKGSTARPPVVVVMGHVDHGKTTLLDTIRNTNVVAGESGGITQHIGAYQVEVHPKDEPKSRAERGIPSKKQTLRPSSARKLREGKQARDDGSTGSGRTITFLDTPGHEAFSAMRAHGAALTDVAVLVVAADDGVKPQTKEAISHANAANVPIVVAINKIDVPGADVERVKRELADAGVVPEAYGGTTPMVPVSAKQGTGINELLDVLLLVADLAEPTADPEGDFIGTVIEAKQAVGAGVVATILVQNGTLAVGDTLVVGGVHGRVKFLKTATGERVETAGPSTPVQIAGLNGVPAVGQRVERVATERAARARIAVTEGTVTRGQTLGDVSRAIRRGTQSELPVILKADVQGSVDAIAASLEQLSTDTAEVRLLHAAVGPINESDVQLAIASNALIVAFRVSVSPAAERLADQQRVLTLSFDVIYALLDEVKLALEGKLEPEVRTTVTGTLNVLKTFRTTPTEKLVGGLVTKGELRRTGRMRIYRGDELVGEAAILGLQQGPEKVDSVPAGSECGVLLGTKLVIATDDRLECVVEETITVRLGTLGR